MNTWIDTRTGLTWQVVPPDECFDYAAAEKYALALDGDWRLPIKSELMGISGKNSPKELEGDGFFWSSSPVGDYDGSAWVVSFNYGYVYHSNVNYDYLVRCVREVR